MAEPYEVDRAEIARIMYDESRRLRDLQDSRISDIRQRSITVLSLVSASVVVVAGLANPAQVNSVAVGIALVAVVLMVLAGVVVHIPIGSYMEGPNIQDLDNHQYTEADPGYQVYRDVSLYHWDHYLHNNRKVRAWVNNGFAAELVFAATAVAAIVLGAVV